MHYKLIPLGPLPAMLAELRAPAFAWAPLPPDAPWPRPRPGHVGAMGELLPDGTMVPAYLCAARSWIEAGPEALACVERLAAGEVLTEAPPQTAALCAALGVVAQLPASKPAKPLPEPRAARLAAGLSQTAAAALVGASRGGWAKWEVNDPVMPAPLWHLFQLRTDQHPTARLEGTIDL